METIRRKSCRAILLSPDNEVLLIKIANPSSSWQGWITPGGGLEEGESEIAGLRRELKEELGFRLEIEVPRVWIRSHGFSWSGKWIEQDEVFYLVRTSKFSPAGESALTESEILDFKEIRWWTLSELMKSRELFAPSRFPGLLGQLLEEGIPANPRDVGI